MIAFKLKSGELGLLPGILSELSQHPIPEENKRI